MTRREWIAAGLAAKASWAKSRIDRSRLSAITDEIGKTAGEAIAFARQYGLRWVELRGVPGSKRYYCTMSEQEARGTARELAAGGLKVSFLNTGLLKFALPGTEPVRRREESPDGRARRIAAEQRLFDERMKDLQTAIRAAHVLGTDKMRVFAFHRVAEPAKLLPRIADILGEMARVAEKEKVQLLIENEGSCNVATCAELAEILKLLPSPAIGINWDPHNELGLKVTPFPDGYALLPKKRIGNVQVKARSIMPGPHRLDWEGIYQALEKDGYKGKIGLETHVFDGTLIEAAHASIQEMIRIAERRQAS